MKEKIIELTKKHLIENCGIGTYLSIEKAIQFCYFVNGVKWEISKIAFDLGYEITITEIEEIYNAAISTVV